MTELDRVTTLEKKGTFDYIPSTLADRSTGLHQVSLLLSTKEVVEKAKHMLIAGY
jgi:hypothetical protein